MTKQLAEHIVVDGIECLLLSTPLDSVLGAVPLVPPHTALWRGYIGEWRIEGDYLLLMGLRGWVPGSDGTPVEVSADVVLPGWILPVAASWVTSTLRVAAGAELRYVHARFESTYEHEWLLEVRNGIVVSREKLATSSVGQAGPFLVDDSDFWSGAFGSLLTARGPDARPLVAKVPRPCGGQGNTEVWSSGETPRLPVHTPASTYRRTSAGWERWRLSDADVAAVLERENEILIRDGGQLLPFSHGIWTLEPLGLPALIMERLEGSHPAGPTDVRATLAAVARAVERGTFPAHGDLKFEHVFVEPAGRVRMCDPAPIFADPQLRAFTQHYNPHGWDGAPADVAACASMLRFLRCPEGQGGAFAAAVLSDPEPPRWAGDYDEALRRLDLELGTAGRR